MSRATVDQIIPIDGSQNDIFQVHDAHRLRRVLRLLRIHSPARITGIHGTEPACPGTNVAHEHDRGRAAIPALADVRTKRFLTNRTQTMHPDIAPHLRETPSRRQPHTKPRRLSVIGFRISLATPANTIFNRRKSACGPILFAASDYRDAFKIAQKLESGHT